MAPWRCSTTSSGPQLPIIIDKVAVSPLVRPVKLAQSAQGEPLKDTALFMDRVRREATLHGRKPSFSLSTRPILAASEDAAWERARAILDRVLANRGGAPPPKRQNVGSQRLLEAAAASEIHDTCLWTPLAAATGAQGNSTALVGTPETVAKAMLEYYKLGATSLLIRGYDPRPDAVQYGEELIPRLRQLVAEHDAVRSIGDAGNDRTG